MENKKIACSTEREEAGGVPSGSRKGRPANTKGSRKTAEQQKNQAREQVEFLLQLATPAAAKLMVEVMKDEDNPNNLRIDMAKEILNRVYGKSSQIVEAEAESDKGITIVLSDELKRYAT